MKIAVIYGEPEQDASQASARRIADALQEANHEPFVVEANDNLMNRLRGERPEMAISALRAEAVADGSIPSMLSALSIPYIGSSAGVCKNTRDKTTIAQTMQIYQEITHEEPCVNWPHGVVITRRAYKKFGGDAQLDAWIDAVPGGFPVCVKPAVGFEGKHVYRAGNDQELDDCLQKVFKTCDRALVQQWVDGIEIAVCITGNGWDAQALPPVEVHPKSAGFFNAKSHQHLETVELVSPVRPTKLSDDAAEAEAIRSEIERAALEVYRAYGVRDFGRVQLRWDGAQAQVLSIDVAPDMARSSIFSFAVAASHQNLADIFEYIIENRD